MKKLRIAALAALVCALGASGLAYGAGVWNTWVGIGQPSYCASTVSGVVLPTSQGPYGVVPGSTQGTGQGICGQTVPAGPATFSGTEMFPVDLYALGANVQAGGPTSALVELLQLGQGPMLDVTTVGTTQTIPNATPFYFLDGAQGSALTVTMPASAIEGQIQRVICESATVGTLTIAANTGQTLKGNPNTACVAGVGYAYRYQASNSTWYKF